MGGVASEAKPVRSEQSERRTEAKRSPGQPDRRDSGGGAQMKKNHHSYNKTSTFEVCYTKTGEWLPFFLHNDMDDGKTLLI